MVRVIIEKLQLAAPGIEVRFVLDVALGVGDDIGGLQVVG
jgi:hypothetical protein